MPKAKHAADPRLGYSIVLLIASVLGSVVGSIVSVAINYSELHARSTAEAPVLFLVMSLLIFALGSLISIPAGLLFGAPLTAVSHQYLCRNIILATLAFAVIGLSGGLAIQKLGGSGGLYLRNAELAFGACIGGMHPLVYGRGHGVGWFKILLTSLLSALVVPALACAGKDIGNLMDSRRAFETKCADRHGSMAFKADRVALERSGDPVEAKGRWIRDLGLHSLYVHEDRFPLNNTHVLIARDYACAPGGLAGWITGGRRLERHCWSKKKGSDADMLRARGFGKPPKLQYLAH